MRRICPFVLAILFLVAAPGARAQVEVYWVGPAVVDVSEGAGSIVLQVGLSAPGAGSQFVLYDLLESGTAATPGDFGGGSGFLNWAPGDGTAQDVTLTIVDDAVAEGTETIFVALTSADGPVISPTDNVIQINILDNDGGATLPHITIEPELSGDALEKTRYCYDGSGDVYACGTDYVINIGVGGGFVRVATSDGQAVADTVRFDLVSWGGVSVLFGSGELRPGESGQTFIISTNDSELRVVGGVRLANLHNVAPAGPDDHHAATIFVEAPEPPDITDCFLCILVTYVFADEFLPCVGDCSVTVGCGGPPAGSSGKAVQRTAGSDMDQLRRYRDEILASTPDGQAITSLYGEMGVGLINTFLAQPSLAGEFMAARNDWMPALGDLLDGTGAMTITPTMQSTLTALLDAVAAVATGDLVGQVADLRAAGGLDALTGQTVAQAHQAFVTGGATPIEATSWGDLKSLYR